MWVDGLSKGGDEVSGIKYQVSSIVSKNNKKRIEVKIGVEVQWETRSRLLRLLKEFVSTVVGMAWAVESRFPDMIWGARARLKPPIIPAKGTSRDYLAPFLLTRRMDAASHCQERNEIIHILYTLICAATSCMDIIIISYVFATYPAVDIKAALITTAFQCPTRLGT
jgi:hypothetical protein